MFNIQKNESRINDIDRGSNEQPQMLLLLFPALPSPAVRQQAPACAPLSCIKGWLMLSSGTKATAMAESSSCQRTPGNGACFGKVPEMSQKVQGEMISFQVLGL
jgi:hypothetical protein